MLAAPSQQTIATKTDDQRNTQPQDEGDGYQPGAGRMTAQCRMATWNVRTMFQTGNTAEVEREMLLCRIDILGISERRWTGKWLCASRTTSPSNTILREE